MPEDIQRRVQTDFIARDQATRPLSAIASAGSRVSGIFNQASNVMGLFGGAAGAAAGVFAVKSVITGTMQYLESVKRIADVTGISAGNADALLDTFSKADITAREAQRVIMMMSGAMSRAAMSGERMRGHMYGASRLVAQMGIDVRKGPEQALVKLAGLAKVGKLGVDQLRIAYRLPYESARKLMELLRKGPEGIKTILGELQKRGIAVTSQDLVNYKRMKDAQRDIGSAWERIRLLIGVRLIPVLADMLEKVRANMERWEDHAKEFGESMSKFLRDHYRLVINIGKVLLANFTLMKLTGGAGMGDLMTRGGKAALASKVGGAGQLAKIGPGMLIAAAAAVTIAVSVKAWSDNVLGVQDYVALQFEKIKAHAESVESAMMKILGPMFRLFGVKPGGLGFLTLKLAALPLKVMSKAVELFAHYIAAAWRFISLLGASIIQLVGTPFMKLYEFMKTNAFDPAAKEITRLWETAREKFFNPILDWIHKAWEFIQGIIAKVASFIPGGLKAAAATATGGAGKVVGAITAPAAAVVSLAKRAWQETGMEADAAARQAASLALVAEGWAGLKNIQKDLTKDRTQPPVYDFRGSRFDITQKFAEGFDPDRIAVAFTNDLATLGERKLQSGFAPIFALR